MNILADQKAEPDLSSPASFFLTKNPDPLFWEGEIRIGIVFTESDPNDMIRASINKYFNCCFFILYQEAPFLSRASVGSDKKKREKLREDLEPWTELNWALH